MTIDKTKISTVSEVIEDMKPDNEDQARGLLDVFEQTSWEYVSMRMDLGRYVRNTYGLWQQNHALAEDCVRIDPKTACATNPNPEDCPEIMIAGGKVHPDRVS